MCVRCKRRCAPKAAVTPSSTHAWRVCSRRRHHRPPLIMRMTRTLWPRRHRPKRMTSNRPHYHRHDHNNLTLRLITARRLRSARLLPTLRLQLQRRMKMNWSRRHRLSLMTLKAKTSCCRLRPWASSINVSHLLFPCLIADLLICLPCLISVSHTTHLHSPNPSPPLCPSCTPLSVTSYLRLFPSLNECLCSFSVECSSRSPISMIPAPFRLVMCVFCLIPSLRSCPKSR
jgi:hypothetical protein